MPTETPVAGLPDDVDAGEVESAVRVAVRDPSAVLLAAAGEPLAHRISAPTTRSLTRLRARVRTGSGDAEVTLVAKALQAARHGLPPQLPDDLRARIDALIPWRLEAQIYVSGLGEAMPPGLRMPRLLGLTEQPDDRAVLWLEDVAAPTEPWTPERSERTARQLGRLAARRRLQPELALPGGPFLDVFLDQQLRSSALPALAGDATWAHPAFADPDVAGLRRRVDALARRVDEMAQRLARTPSLPAHGDPTPMNLLGPEEDCVLIDWGTATPAPAGFDLLPLVFGRAESGAGEVQELPGLLSAALPAYRAGLAEDGVDVDAADLAAAAVAMAQLRYAFTGLPLDELGGSPPDDPAAAVPRRRRRSAFVAAVLDLDPARL